MKLKGKKNVEQKDLGELKKDKPVLILLRVLRLARIKTS